MITVVAAVIGWSIVERFARQRERRVKVKAMVTSFIAAVNEISGDAIRYYELEGASARAVVLSKTLKSGISTLGDVIEALKFSGVELSKGDTSLKVFRQVITGGVFDTMERTASPSGAPVFELIANASASLARNMQLAHFRSMALRKAHSKT